MCTVTLVPPAPLLLGLFSPAVAITIFVTGTLPCCSLPSFLPPPLPLFATFFLVVLLISVALCALPFCVILLGFALHHTATVLVVRTLPLCPVALLSLLLFLCMC